MEIEKIPHTRKVYECKSCGSKWGVKPLFCDKMRKNNKICGNKIITTVNVYCLDRIIAYETPVRAIIGRRRGGKTYAVSERAVSLWEKNGTKTMWIRRYTTEYKKALENFIKLGYKIDKKGVFLENEVTLSVWDDKKQKTIDKKSTEKEYIVNLISITTASRLRGGYFDDFSMIVWDEYGDEAQSYRKSENDLFYSIMVSVFDDRNDVEVWILSNNCNRFLPLWIQAEVDWTKEWNYNYHKAIVVHIWDTKDYDMTGALSKFLKGTDYYDYAVKNKSLQTDDYYLINENILKYMKAKYCIRYNVSGKITSHTAIYDLTMKEKDDKIYIVLGNCNVGCKNDQYALDFRSAVISRKLVNEAVASELKENWYNGSLLFTRPFLRDNFIEWLINSETQGGNNKWKR